ncbi:hypothetical protein V6C27_10955 [Peptococcaceae bacterium 1198_IL3148]
MNISKILPALLKVQQPKNVTSQQTPKNSFINQQALKDVNAMKATVSVTKETAVKDQDSIQPRPANHPEITYLPLPLKAEPFKSALFFVRKYNNNQSVDEQNSSAFFIKLDTDNLGVVWIGLEHMPQQGLGVRFVTDQECHRQAIAEILPAIKQDLVSLGCGNVVTTCYVQTNVRHCQDIDPCAVAAEVITSLMDWTV